MGTMNSIRAVFLLVLAAEAQYTTGPCWPQEGAVDVCCDSKKVGDFTYTKVSTGKVPDDCMSDCIYTRDDKPGSRFCFAKGAQEVMCLAGCTEGLTQCGPHGGQNRILSNLATTISFNECNYWKALAAPDGGVVGWNISVWTPPDGYQYGTTETYVQGFRMYYGQKDSTRPGEPAHWHGSFAYRNTNGQPDPPNQGTVEYSLVELPVGDFITGITGWTVERPADDWYDVSVVGGLSFITNNGTIYKYGSTAQDCTLANYTTKVFACADNTNKCGLKYISGRTGTVQGNSLNGVGGFLDQLSFWFEC